MESFLHSGARVWKGESADAGIAPEPRHWPYAAARDLLVLPHETALATIFETLAAWMDADRAWMFEYSPDLSVFRNSHEWCRDGVSSHRDDLQNTPVTLMGELQHNMVLGNPVLIPDVAALGRSMRSLQIELVRQSILNTLTVPIHHDGRLHGAIGLDATRRHRDWDDAVAGAVLRIARLIGAARYGNLPPARERREARFLPLVYLRTARSVRGVALGDISLVRADRDQSLVTLADGSTISDLRPLKWWGQVLPPARFARLHRSALAQVSRITSLNRRSGGGWRAEVEGLEQPTNVSRNALPDLRSRLGY